MPIPLTSYRLDGRTKEMLTVLGDYYNMDSTAVIKLAVVKLYHEMAAREGQEQAAIAPTEEENAKLV